MLPWWLMVKNSPANARDTRDIGLIPGLGRSPGVGNDNPLQYSCLENSMDRGAWWATIHGMAKELDMTGHTQDISSVQSLSCVLFFATPMDGSTLGFPVHHQLLELAQTHVHRVGDAIQPSHPLSSPSPPAFNLSQRQRLFK